METAYNPPVVRNSDPATAHTAAAMIERTRPSRRDAVRAFLELNQHRWVAGHEIACPEVGGSEGLRRLRELHDRGLKIRRRPSENGEHTTWYYRLESACLAEEQPQ